MGEISVLYSDSMQSHAPTIGLIVYIFIKKYISHHKSVINEQMGHSNSMNVASNALQVLKPRDISLTLIAGYCKVLFSN